MKKITFIILLTIVHLHLQSQVSDSSEWMVGFSVFQDIPVGSFSSSSSSKTIGNAQYGASAGLTVYYLLDPKSALSFMANTSFYMMDENALGQYYEQEVGTDFQAIDFPDLLYNQNYFVFGYQREIHRFASDFSILVNPYAGLGLFNKSPHSFSFNEQPFSENSNSIFLPNQTIRSTYEIQSFNSSALLLGAEIAFLADFDYQKRDFFVMGQLRYSYANYTGKETTNITDFNAGQYELNENITVQYRSISVGVTAGVRF